MSDPNSFIIPVTNNNSNKSLISIVKQSETSLIAVDTNQSSVNVTIKPKRKAIVLEEEEYLQTIEHIIKRDYYPHLLNHNQNNNNTNHISTNHVNNSFEDETPATLRHINNSDDKNKSGNNINNNSGDIASIRAKDLTLNSFLQSHTTEDNASFHKLVENQQAKDKQQKRWLYNNQNQLMFIPEHLTFNKDENAQQLLIQAQTQLLLENKSDTKSDRENTKNNSVDDNANKKLKTKHIAYHNTRFQSIDSSPASVPTNNNNNIFDSLPPLESINGTPRINGYSFMKTPAINNNYNNNNNNVTPIVKSEPKSDRGYRVPATPAREQLLLKLTSATHRKRLEAEKSRSKQISVAVTPDRSVLLSPAAHQLLTRNNKNQSTNQRSTSIF